MNMTIDDYMEKQEKISFDTLSSTSLVSSQNSIPFMFQSCKNTCKKITCKKNFFLRNYN